MTAFVEDLESYRAVVRTAIRNVKDFPKPGVTFWDIQPLLADPDALFAAAELMQWPTLPDKIVGIESRGLIFGAVLAQHCGIGLIPLRKKGKLPPPIHSIAYKLEYGEAEVEISANAFKPGEKILIVDDVLATGGTLAAAVNLIRSNFNVTILGCSVLLEIPALNGRKAVDVPIRSAI